MHVFSPHHQLVHFILGWNWFIFAISYENDIKCARYVFSMLPVLGGALRGNLGKQRNLARADGGVRRRFHRQPGGTPKKRSELTQLTSISFSCDIFVKVFGLKMKLRLTRFQLKLTFQLDHLSRRVALKWTDLRIFFIWKTFLMKNSF